MAQVTVELMKLLTIPKFKLFDFDYVFDDLTFKAKLEQFITDYFYEYEVAGDSVEAFKHKFRTRYQRIIPYYNSLYNTTLLSYNPLINSKSTETGNNLTDTKNNGSVISINSGSDTTNNTNTGNTTNNSNTKKSDYPQQPILNGDFLSGEDIVNGGSTNSNTNSGNTVTNSKNDNVNNSNSILNNEYEKVVEGISGTTYPELIKQHRATILRIQEDIIKEMKSCFILAY